MRSLIQRTKRKAMAKRRTPVSGPTMQKLVRMGKELDRVSTFLAEMRNFLQTQKVERVKKTRVRRHRDAKKPTAVALGRVCIDCERAIDDKGADSTSTRCLSCECAKELKASRTMPERQRTMWVNPRPNVWGVRPWGPIGTISSVDDDIGPTCDMSSDALSSIASSAGSDEHVRVKGSLKKVVCKK